MSSRTVSVRLAADVSAYVNAIGRNAVKATKDLNSELAMLGKDHREKFNQLTTVAGTAGLALSGAFGLIVRAGADFDKQMSAVNAVSDGSTASLAQLRQAALDAGKATAYTATQAAQAEEELAKAGISTSDILGGALSGTLSLAAAGSIDLADAATIAAQAMNEFKLHGGDVSHIADVLAAGANKSATDVGKLGQSLSQAGLVASQTGLSLEDTVGTLSAFAQAGLVGSDAGTSLKTMLQQLQSASGPAAATMAELGINAYDASGSFIGITKLADQLQRKLGGLTQAQRDSAMAQIFGTDAVRAATVLYAQGAAGLQKWIDGVNDEGAAAEAAAKKLDNLDGDLKKLRGSLDAMAISSSGAAMGGLRPLVQMSTALVNQFAGMPPAVSGTITALTGLTGTALLAGAGIAKVRQSSREAVEALSGMGPMGAKASTALEGVTKWGTRAGLALVGLEVAGALSSLFAQAAASTDLYAASLDKFAKTGEHTGEMLRLTGKDFSQFEKDVKFTKNLGSLADLEKGASFEPGFMKGFDGSLQSTLERMKGLDGALAQMVQGGHAQDAQVAFGALADAAGKQGVSVQQLKAMLPGYAKALDDAAKANGGAGMAASDAAIEYGNLAQQLNRTTVTADSLAGIMTDKLVGSLLGMDQASLGVQESLTKLSESFAQNGRGIDIHTAKGQANREAVLAQVSANLKLYDQQIQTGISAKDAAAAYDANTAALDKQLRAAGLTAAQVDSLIGKYRNVPDDVNTNIATNGLTQAINDLNELIRKLNGLPPLKTVTVRYDEIHAQSWLGHGAQGKASALNRWGGVYTHAAEGTLRQADVYATASPARYAYAEPSTGGEAFVPRFGDYARSTAILDRAARWYGGSFTPAGAGGTSYVDSRTVHYHINNAIDPSKVVAAIVKYEKSNGANWRR